VSLKGPKKKRIPKRAACYSLNRSHSLSKPYLQHYRNLGKNESLEEQDVHDEDVHDRELHKNRELKECERKRNSGAFMSRILAIQILYLAAFAAAHSFMASRPFKGLMWRILGPRTDRLYMKFFSIFAAITFAPLILMILIFPGKKLYLVPSP
jgi:hypothetical protein